MLNSIALWDKVEVPGSRRPDGSLSVKAGIRPDWKTTRSDFCYKKSAPGALRNLIDRIDARYIVLSYNTEGIIPFDELYEILSCFGRTEIFCRDYIIYRGGKQSIGRANRNVEFQLVLSRNETPQKSDRSRIDRILRSKSIISLMNESFSPKRIKERFSGNEDGILIGEGELSSSFRMESFYRFAEVPALADFDKLTAAELQTLFDRLEYCRCVDKEEEARILMGLILDFNPTEQTVSFYRKCWTTLIRTVRKFAFKKYKDEFNSMFEDVRMLLSEEIKIGKLKDWTAIEKNLEELGRIAGLRINN